MANAEIVVTKVTASDTRPVPGAVAAGHQAAIILTAVLAGAVLTTWLVEASVGSSAELWIGYHKATTAAYTSVLPPIGALALIAALAALHASWRNPRPRGFILAAVGCLLAGLIVTVVVHFPINDHIATWQSAAPPSDWQQSRDRWLVGHAIRAACVLAALALLAIPHHRLRQTQVAAQRG
jgi:hypothetical protein